MNCTIMEHERIMLSISRFHNGLWSKVVDTTMYMISKSPVIVLDGKILEEVWCGNLVDYSHLCIFGFDAFSHVHK